MSASPNPVADLLRFRERLKSARIDQKMTQGDVARRMGKDPRTVRRWENNEGEPSLTEAALWAHAVGVQMLPPVPFDLVARAAGGRGRTKRDALCAMQAAVNADLAQTRASNLKGSATA
ncbi:XRE family transcriptional regulator (plasmid) [Azospirillum brasilense]|uniref:Epoxidase-like protein n=1 Tax=Azospirillum brasilense TaxID=192 RepID=Q6QW48_AZOBR|nr:MULTISPECIES: helix-turn-helix transcriptional regulator [Azospirillum]YP_001686852.1 transcriptional regulator [Azospirillum phage Cd]AAS83072.1 epoxidase-like protein [Azospirillum brasilense]MDW7555411.1 helix-turn-helix transcriptional regulator [Azospirillum brasilense]MDW7595181.1 helix-turn-helix transcriptional regulator [Azospirillum brasilense]MDW7630334.1 helix-turn-helix transcriptional regulator [Azospirillum brasilense]MDX5949702.1 helix-turn-helix transcriptional regulator [